MRRSSGFTLLEVMVAMTITALALGSLFSVIAGNKRLAWRAEAALLHSIEVRSLINSAQLNDAQGEAFTETRKDKLQLVTEEELPVPERKTQTTSFDLRGYHIKDEHGAEIASGTYWLHLQLPVAPGSAEQGQGLQQGVQATSPGTFQPGQGRNLQQGTPGAFQPGQGRNFQQGPFRNFPPGAGRNVPQGQRGNFRQRQRGDVPQDQSAPPPPGRFPR